LRLKNTIEDVADAVLAQTGVKQYAVYWERQIFRLLRIVFGVVDYALSLAAIAHLVRKILAFNWEPVNLVALRPDLADYDRTYNLHCPEGGLFENFGDFRSITLQVEKQTFREYATNPKPTPRAYLMLDVTYYLGGDFSAENRVEFHAKDTVHYATASFHTVPGVYRLPWGCGKVIVENRVHNSVNSVWFGGTPVCKPQRIT